MHFKDAILDSIASKANIAQFVSFSPDLTQRFSRVYGFEPNNRFQSIADSAQALLTQAPEHSVNVRSFEPDDPKSREFIYGLSSATDVEREVRRLAWQGLYTIVNETVDVHDGGVSGVAFGDTIEFAPDDTPRCVEKAGTAAFPRKLGLSVLEMVYGFIPQLDFDKRTRVEFSIHPLRRGVRREHTIVWELEEFTEPAGEGLVRWPNLFSQLLGDKAFGLLIADLLRLPVPRTTVFPRRIAPFAFGDQTHTAEYWLRTCPRIQVPGKFTTRRGWIDPFELLREEDPAGDAIASVIAQEGVDAQFSGAALTTPDGSVIIEGTAGLGDEFMIGVKPRSTLPPRVVQSVQYLQKRISDKIGPVRFEWVRDKKKVWIVQFHRGASPSFGRTIYPGEPSRYIEFDVREGLEALRALVTYVGGTGAGIELRGDVGITSHFGDILRRAKIPSIISELVATNGAAII